MTIRTVILAALAVVPTIGSVMADERINITPPIYREQAHATAAVRSVSELATTPRLVPAAELSRTVANITEPEVTGSLAR
ncbi:hypothetical protein ACRAWG_10675 [Methylobacterium sp. P31]